MHSTMLYNGFSSLILACSIVYKRPQPKRLISLFSPVDFLNRSILCLISSVLFCITYIIFYNGKDLHLSL